MITKFKDFLNEDRHFVDKKYYDMESDFEPLEKKLQEIYYNELEKLYQTNLRKYRLVLDILKTNKILNDSLSKKKPPFSYFKSLLKSSEPELKINLKNLKGLIEDEFSI